ncbi:MAG: hypothetical protein ACI8SE_001778 [Bacteroidia bacterium]|jgi:hypothetical protein
MRAFITVLSVFCLYTLSHAQGRSIDIASKIVDPMEGDSFVSPTKKTVSVYLYNLGPDTIIPKDEYSVKFIFSAFHIFPQFHQFITTLFPGDSFLYQQELNINYSGDVESMKFCTEAFAFSSGRDSIKREIGDARLNNKHCVKTRHIDSTMTSNVVYMNRSKFKIYPIPASAYLSVESSDILESVRLFSTSGALIHSIQNIHSLTAEIDINDYDSGIYYLSLKTINGTNLEKVIIAK